MLVRSIEKKDNEAIAKIVRTNLKAFQLDIPGTVYFDSILDHLSDDYEGKERRYYFILENNGKVVGGVGLSEFDFVEGCCELQKLYLDDSVKGNGYAKMLISKLEDKARELGYSKMYLETHHNLQPAIHLYKRVGFIEIERPDFVQHSTMDTFFIKDL